MTKILAVYDADPVFAKRLADYVNQKETGVVFRIDCKYGNLGSLIKP